MTLTEARDRIAWKMGWTVSVDGLWSRPEWGEDHIRSQRAGVLPRHDHPVPSTIDGILHLWDTHAKGWVWTREYMASISDPEYGLVLTWRAFHEVHGNAYVDDTNNVLHDLTMLLLATLERKEGKAQ